MAMQITDPTTVDDEKAQYNLGTKAWYDYELADGSRVANEYRYVKFLDAVAYVAGHALAGTATPWNVTNDRSGGTTNVGVRGVGLATRVHTQNYFGWMLVSGIHENCLTDGGVTAGEALVLHSVDGAVDSMADGEEEQVFAQALTTDAGSPTVSTVHVFAG